MAAKPSYNTALSELRRFAAERVVSAAAELHIGLTPSDAVMVDPEDPVSGIRLCLGPSFDELAGALSQLDGLLRSEREAITDRSA